MDFGTVIDAAFSAALGPQAIVFALAAIGLNVHFGYTGLINFGQAGFMSIAAFGVAVSVVTWDLNFYLAVAIGLVGSVVLALVLGGALAGLSGVLFGLDEQVQWNMGSRLLLLMFAAITLGGLGRPFGALVGSLVVGLMVQLWAWFFSGYADLKNVGALLALILILLVRPQGILGKAQRIG
jgi:branched-subunit amino acid ABC-type transport system permease component